jgi:hypothetical protein
VAAEHDGEGQKWVSPDREEESRGSQSSPASPSSSSTSVTFVACVTSIKALTHGKIKARDELFILVSKLIPFLWPANEILDTITFSTTVSLAQVMVMMKVLTNHAPHYDILSHQCYWYAATLFTMLQAE